MTKNTPKVDAFSPSNFEKWLKSCCSSTKSHQHPGRPRSTTLTSGAPYQSFTKTKNKAPKIDAFPHAPLQSGKNYVTAALNSYPDPICGFIQYHPQSTSPEAHPQLPAPYQSPKMNNKADYHKSCAPS